MTSQRDTRCFGSGAASLLGWTVDRVQSARSRGWQCQRSKAWCKAKAKCCHQCGLRWQSPGHGQSATQVNPVTSALEGVAAKLQEALGDHAGSQVSLGEVSTEAGATSCGTDGSLALEKADAEVAQLTREGAGQSAAWTGGGETGCGSRGTGQVHEQDLGRHEEVPQHPTRSCERNGDVDEKPRGGRGPSGDVLFLSRLGTRLNWSRARPSGWGLCKSGRYYRIWKRGGTRTPAHDGIVCIDGANRRVAGHGRSHGVNIADPRAQRSRDEKRHWPEQFSEDKSPWEELGSKGTPTQGPCRRARKDEFVARSGSHHFRVATEM